MQNIVTICVFGLKAEIVLRHGTHGLRCVNDFWRIYTSVHIAASKLVPNLTPDYFLLRHWSDSRVPCVQVTWRVGTFGYTASVVNEVPVDQNRTEPFHVFSIIVDHLEENKILWELSLSIIWALCSLCRIIFQLVFVVPSGIDAFFVLLYITY